MAIPSALPPNRVADDARLADRSKIGEPCDSLAAPPSASALHARPIKSQSQLMLSRHCGRTRRRSHSRSDGRDRILSRSRSFATINAIAPTFIARAAMRERDGSRVRFAYPGYKGG